MRRMLKQLARKELQQFASTVQARIVKGKPSKKRTKETTSFAGKVDGNLEAFQGYFDRTGVYMKKCPILPTPSHPKPAFWKYDPGTQAVAVRMLGCSQVPTIVSAEGMSHMCNSHIQQRYRSGWVLSLQGSVLQPSRPTQQLPSSSVTPMSMQQMRTFSAWPKIARSMSTYWRVNVRTSVIWSATLAGCGSTCLRCEPELPMLVYLSPCQ